MDLLDLSANPITEFQRWLDEAASAGRANFPTAMSLATVGKNGRPSVRMVLLKGVSEKGFSFFTNLESRKGQELTLHPYAALCFFWDGLGRQVRIEGRVERLTREESTEYFHTRPRGSQLGAWASPQSQEIPDRAFLDTRLKAAEEKFAGAEIPLPEFWGGFRLVPERIEFWQSRENRLHDRLLFARTNTEAPWKVTRLAP